MDKGSLITFEGGEGAGKSTHIKRLKSALEVQGFRVLIVREPGGTVVGEAIRAVLLTRDHDMMSPRTELLLYEAARAQLVDEVIRPALEEGMVVLCDRFTDSTTAYQGYGRGLDIEMIKDLNLSATGGIIPVCTIVIDVPVDAGLLRATRKGEPDRLESEDTAFHEAVRAGFIKIAQSDPERVHMIDGTRKKGVVSAEIQQIVFRVLNRV